MNMQVFGPAPMAHEQRMELAHKIAVTFKDHFGAQLIAIGIYGSLARSDDGPFSDIEMFCVVEGQGIDDAVEWTTGPWKAEVDIYSPDALLTYAAEVEGDWALTHGSMLWVLPIYDPDAFFERLKETVSSQPDEAFRAAMAGLIVGEIYEVVGKVRNCQASGKTSSLALYTVELASYGAWLIGLANRHHYLSSSTMLTEALPLPGQPAGYESLCQIVTRGELQDHKLIYQVADDFWRGVIDWCAINEIPVVRQLDQLLTEESI
jgi:kanamycin nucleotidyltransferase